VDQYTEPDVHSRADEVYRHVFRAYPTLPSPHYGAQMVVWVVSLGDKGRRWWGTGSFSLQEAAFSAGYTYENNFGHASLNTRKRSLAGGAVILSSFPHFWSTPPHSIASWLHPDLWARLSVHRRAGGNTHFIMVMRRLIRRGGLKIQLWI